VESDGVYYLHPRNIFISSEIVFYKPVGDKVMKRENRSLKKFGRKPKV